MPPLPAGAVLPYCENAYKSGQPCALKSSASVSCPTWFRKYLWCKGRPLPQGDQMETNFPLKDYEECWVELRETPLHELVANIKIWLNAAHGWLPQTPKVLFILSLVRSLCSY